MTLSQFNRNETAQTVKARADQVKNNAGGYTFTVTDAERLRRFLILGVDAGTYYVTTPELVRKNVDFLSVFVKRDARAFIDIVAEVSKGGHAKSNTPAIFALALALNDAPAQDKAYIRGRFNEIVRTGTHLFEFSQFVENLGGWGSAKRKAVAGWYEGRTAEKQAFQVVKYRQRNGWTHKDTLRLSHAKPDANVANFALGKPFEGAEETRILEGFARVQGATTIDEVVGLVNDYGLTWEAVPTQFHKELKLWKTLFESGNLQGQALVRQITRLARLDAFSDLVFARKYAEALTDEAMIERTRLHPINFLNARIVHERGQQNRTGNGWWSYADYNKNWTTSNTIVEALEDGFYKSFKTVEPSGKRTSINLDVSGSMSQAAAGVDLTCYEVAAFVGMLIARTEKYHVINAFSTTLTPINIGPKTTFAQALNEVQRVAMGGTDCARPMTQAIRDKQEIDTFVVITDNETWAGGIQPHQALVKYRKALGIDAKLAVFAVTATPFTIADPNDPGMMDFVGFDSTAPRVLADFSAGRL